MHRIRGTGRTVVSYLWLHLVEEVCKASGSFEKLSSSIYIHNLNDHVVAG